MNLDSDLAAALTPAHKVFVFGEKGPALNAARRYIQKVADALNPNLDIAVGSPTRAQDLAHGRDLHRVHRADVVVLASPTPQGRILLQIVKSRHTAAFVTELVSHRGARVQAPSGTWVQASLPAAGLASTLPALNQAPTKIVCLLGLRSSDWPQQ